MVQSRFLKLIVELNRIRCQCGFKDREQLVGLLKDAIDLWAKGIGSRIMPPLQGAAMRVNDVVVARDDILQANIVVPDGGKDTRSQWIDALVDAAMIWGVCKSSNVGLIGTEFPCAAIPILIAR